QELVGSTRPWIWRNLLVAAGIITVILTRETGAAGLLPKASEQTPTQQGGISLEEVLYGSFSPVQFNGTWVSDTEFIYRSSTGGLNLYDAPTLTTNEVVTPAIMRKWRPFKYSLSPSRKYILFVHDELKLFRYSYLAKHTIINLETGEDIPLASQRVRNRAEQPLLLYATWAPTDDSIAFVFNNDLYYTTRPDLATMYRLTNNGQIGIIFNGVPDWVYEEEILGSNSAIWFAPDSKRLVFATFNDSSVDTMNFPLYGRPGDLASQYPIQQSIKYPK
ncbi:unnamed protein product, partial [Meganyctiphanes norvegica]